MQSKNKPKPSLKPQRITSNAWYYENKGSLDFVVWNAGKCTEFRLSSRRLMATLKRQGKL